MAKRESTIDLSGSLSLPGHEQECLCVGCMNLDMDAHILNTMGQDALDRINSEMQLINGGKVAAERMRFMAPGTRTGNGYVRKISAKQAKFIISLINSRDTSGIKIYPGQTLDPNKVNTMGLPAAKALIDKLLNAPILSVRMATEGQIRFIHSLNAQTNPAILTESDIRGITFAEVNEVLECLKTVIANQPKEAEVTVGMYKVDNRIFKVQKSKTSGRLYAKELIDNSFEYAPGAMRIIKTEHRMTLEEAKQYGKETGVCCQCGALLTDPKSIEAGIGPICASKF